VNRTTALIIIIILAIIIALFYFFFYFSQHDLGGWRFNFSLSKVKTNDYQSFGPKLAFKYPDIFEIDSDPQKKYGDNYVVGIKLKTDSRTGCDIRKGGPMLDYSKSIDELTENAISQIRDKAKDFQLIEKEKINIAGRDGFKTSFSFLDPIGARVRLDQIFTQNEGINYMIICGAGEYQFDFFRKDFNILYDSLTF